MLIMKSKTSSGRAKQEWCPASEVCRRLVLAQFGRQTHPAVTSYMWSYNSGMDGPIVTKCRVCLETKPRCILSRSWAGYTSTRRCAPFPHLGNGWTDCAEIWFVVRDSLAWRCTTANGGVQVHVCTNAPLFRISGTAGRIALKLVHD